MRLVSATKDHWLVYGFSSRSFMMLIVRNDSVCCWQLELFQSSDSTATCAAWFYGLQLAVQCEGKLRQPDTVQAEKPQRNDGRVVNSSSLHNTSHALQVRLQGLF